MNYFGQYGEDKIIEDFFPKDYVGTCIDVGSAEGVAGSNTFLFERKGWNCLCIEANISLAMYSSAHRKNVLNYAVGSENKEDVDFNVYEVGPGNFTAISGLKVDQRLVDDHKDLILNMSTIKVETKTLDKILEESPEITKIDFISMDTEGTELDVLKGFDINKWKPKMMVIENNYNDPEIEEYLKEFGYYKYLRHYVNDFYCLAN